MLWFRKNELDDLSPDEQAFVRAIIECLKVGTIHNKIGVHRPPSWYYDSLQFETIYSDSGAHQWKSIPFGENCELTVFGPRV